MRVIQQSRGTAKMRQGAEMDKHSHQKGERKRKKKIPVVPVIPAFGKLG